MDLKIEPFDSINCFLCLSNQDLANSIYSDQEPKVVSILCRHFWFAREDIQQKYVCSTCWAQVEDFNTFYELIERLHDAQDHDPHVSKEPEVLQAEESCLFGEKQETDELLEPDSFLDDSNMETVFIETSDVEETSVEEASGSNVVLAVESITKESSQQKDGLRTRRNFKTVIEFEHTALSENATRHGLDGTKHFKCDQCDRAYPKRHLLSKHQKHHVSDSALRYSCSECGKEYASVSRLQQHKKRVHGPGFMCDICPKWYKTGEALRRHQKDSHNPSETERVECNICKRWFKNKGSLRKHLIRHKTSGMQNVCEICGKVAPTYTALKSHKLFVHQMQKAYQCNICNKAFKRAFTLEEHMTIHTGSTLYNCPHCTKTFNSSANLHGHKKKAHPKEWEKGRI
uniref:C2H2-type domain-containing protein n=1 Tax=Anopheles christyi TaxID=43041 RepID=A0A182K8K6_9DIPT